MREQSEQPNAAIRVLVVDRNQENLMLSKQALLATNLVDLCAETTSYALAVSHVERAKPDFLFCGLDGNPQDAFTLIEKIRDKNPLLRVVCVGDSSDSELILRAFRSGADEYLVAPLKKEALVEMFPRLRQRHCAPLMAPSVIERKGKTLAIWGSRGGCGTTTLACNLAYLIAKTNRTMLVDLHEMQGDLGLFFDQQPLYSLQDIWGRGEKIDESLVDSITVNMEGRLRLLLQSIEEQPGEWSAEDFGRLMGVLQAKYDYTILDIGHDLEIAQRVVSSVDEIYLVVNQNLPSLFLASRKVRWLESVGFNLAQLHIVINGFQARSSVTRNHIAKTLQNQNWVVIRQDERHVNSAINQGIPLQNVSRWGKAHKDMLRVVKGILAKNEQPETMKTSANNLFLRPLLSSNNAVEAMQ